MCETCGCQNKLNEVITEEKIIKTTEIPVEVCDCGCDDECIDCDCDCVCDCDNC